MSRTPDSGDEGMAEQLKPSGIGGQAVMEGVMMRNRAKYAVAVRKPDGKAVAPIRERIKEFSSDEARLDRIARMGAEKARESASRTLNEVRKIIGFRQY